MNSKAKFIDSEFGEWWANPSMVMGTPNRKGSEHPDRYPAKLRLSAEEVQRRITEGVKKIPPRSFILLKKDTYIDTTKKAIFIDEKYGEFEAFVYTVMNGVNHIKRSTKYEWSEKHIKEKLKDRSFLTMDYSTFTGSTNKALFIDEKYGEWWTSPYNVVIKKCDHPTRKPSLSPNEVQRRLSHGYNDIPPRDFVYLDKDSYICSSRKALFIDNKFGKWWAKPSMITNGSNHPVRAYQNSNLETIVSGELNVQRNHKILKTVTGQMIPDFIIDRVIIECDGLYWHSELKKDDKHHHWIRREEAEYLSYNILQFREDEINNKLPIVISIINNKLGRSKKIYARK